MLEEKDYDKIAETIETKRKERLKKESVLSWAIVGGLLFGLVMFGLGTYASNNVGFDYYETRELLELQDLTCNELRQFAPTHISADRVTLEIMQRCV